MRHPYGSSEKTLSKMISLYVNLTVVKQTACLYRLSVKCWDSYPNGHEGAPRIRRRLVNIERRVRPIQLASAEYRTVLLRRIGRKIRPTYPCHLSCGSCGAPALHVPEL
jgi:hypothetical protein